MPRTTIYILIFAILAVGFLALENYKQPETRKTLVLESTKKVSPIVTKSPLFFSEEEIAALSSLWLGNLPPLPADPSNTVADNKFAVDFGWHLFFDKRLSINGEISCASCHKPELKFTDGLPRAQAIGTTPRKTMTIIGTAYSPWLFWDGRKDSQWSQALEPPETSVEHGGNRSMFVHMIRNNQTYLEQYETVFGKFPDISNLDRFPSSAGPIDDPQANAAWRDMLLEDQEVINGIFVNMGKAIAAYERLIMPGPSRFDSFVEAAKASDKVTMKKTLTTNEIEGLRLFIGKAQCINCHNGPLLTNNSFHNTGIPPAADLPPDFGRIEGIIKAKADPFNCLGKYSDITEDSCLDLRYARTEGREIIAAFKTPTLRNVADTAPYMHSGQIDTLIDVVRHYNNAPLAVRGHSELAELGLSYAEMQSLVEFLGTLSSVLATPERLLKSPWPLAQTD